MKDASTFAVILAQAENKEASTFEQVKKKNVSTSVVNVDSEAQETEDESRCKPIQFDKTICGLPFDEPCDIILFDTDSENRQFSLDVVGFVTAAITQKNLH